MALTAEITKESVVKLNESDYQITIHFIVKNESAEILFEKSYSARYFSQLDIDTIKLNIQEQLVADWDKYVAEQAKFNAVQFDDMVAQIQVAANVYINQ